MSIKYHIADSLFLEAENARYMIEIVVNDEKKHNHDYKKRQEVRRSILNRMKTEIDFSEINRAICEIISEEASK